MDTFRALTLNLVALQEVTRLDGFDQAAELLEPAYEIVDHPGASDDGAGACLATRWPISSVELLDLTGVPGSWGLQLDSELVRERQAVEAARFVERVVGGRDDLPVVLLGDFDAAPDEAGHTFTPQNPLVRAGTMPSTPGRRIDYLLVRGGSHGPLLEAAGCGLVLDRPVDGVRGSDHVGVYADLRHPPHPPGQGE